MRDINNYEEEYQKNDFEQMYQVQYRRKKVLESINQNLHKRILEIGCGMQTIGSFISEYDKFTIVEPGVEFVEKAKNDLKDRNNICIINGFVENEIENLKKQQFDFVIISSLLHEVENPLELLEGIKTLCDKDTMVHVNVPNEFSIHRILAYESGLIEKMDKKSERNIQLQQNNIFNLDSLEKMIRKTGNIYVCEKGSYFVKPFSHKQMEQCLATNILDSNILEGLYNLAKYIPEYGSEIFINYKYV